MAFVIIVRAFIDVYKRSIIVVESSFFYMIAAVTQKLRSRDTETELVLKSISAIAVALPDYVAAIAKESGTILGCRLGVHGFNYRDQQNNSQGLKNN